MCAHTCALCVFAHLFDEKMEKERNERGIYSGSQPQAAPAPHCRLWIQNLIKELIREEFAGTESKK